MKHKNLIFYALFLCIHFTGSAEPVTGDWSYLLIREDQVKPNRVEDYEAALYDLKVFIEEGDVAKIEYAVFLKDDYRFMHMSPISDLGELGTSLFHRMHEKISDPEFDLIWADLTDTIYSYEYYVLEYHSDLSYSPVDDKNDYPYRKWSYYRFRPGTETDVRNVIATWRQLYSNKQIKADFEVYSEFLGGKGPTLILSTSGQSPSEYHTRLDTISAELGEEGMALWQAMLANVSQVDTIEGWYLPQYSRYTESD